jgi:proteic killer suppression protein
MQVHASTANPKIPVGNDNPRAGFTWPLAVIFSPRLAVETAVGGRLSPQIQGADSTNILFPNRHGIRARRPNSHARVFIPRRNRSGSYWNARRWEGVGIASTICCFRATPTAGMFDRIIGTSPQGLHKLKGDRKGQWAMTVNDRWRICFQFRKGDAHDVEIVDYHRG